MQKDGCRAGFGPVTRCGETAGGPPHSAACSPHVPGIAQVPIAFRGHGPRSHDGPPTDVNKLSLPGHGTLSPPRFSPCHRAVALPTRIVRAPRAPPRARVVGRLRLGREICAVPGWRPERASVSSMEAAGPVDGTFPRDREMAPACARPKTYRLAGPAPQRIPQRWVREPLCTAFPGSASNPPGFPNDRLVGQGSADGGGQPIIAPWAPCKMPQQREHLQHTRHKPDRSLP